MDGNERATDLRERFRRFLKENQFKQTGERYKILEEIENMDSHFEADDLVIHLRQKGKRVSRATVYRTLNLLEQCGIIRRVRFGENHNHFELAVERSDHAHLICTYCSKVIEFDDEVLEELQHRISEKFRFKPLRRSVEIYGVCPECQKKWTVPSAK